MVDVAPAPRRRLSLRARLVIGFLVAGLLPLLAASGVAYLLARDALTDSARTQLSFLRDEKKRGIEGLFDRAQGSARVLSSGPAVRDSLRGMTEAWARLPQELGWPTAGTEPDAAAAKRRDEAVHGLTQAHADAFGTGEKAASLLPASASALALQVLFVSESPHPLGARHLLDRPRTPTAYGDVHARLHPYAASAVAEYGFDDLALVDAKTGDVVYTYRKRIDLGSNVREGPLSSTALSRAARRALDAAAAHEVAFEDYELYAPAGGKPFAALASPARVDGKTIGAVAVLLPAGPLVRLLAREPGASSSTETYLVGADKKMRSDSPFEKESTFLVKSLDSEAVRESLAGNSGSRRVDDYRGVDSLVAFTPVDLPGVRWGLVRKVDADEELAPAGRLLKWMLGLTIGLVLLALLLAQLLARSIATPVQQAMERLQGTAQSLLSTAQQQQAGAAEAAAAVEETRQTIAGVVGAAQRLRSIGTEVLGNAEVSQRNAQTIGKRIEELSGSTSHIGEMLTLFREIASRSDLLALNAALEGTRAGEAGRGFSLVATQMQRLAEEVMGSVKKIEGLTQEISRSSAGAVLAAEDADKAATRTTTSAHDIAEAVQSQQTATEQVSVAMNEISTVAQNSVDSVRRVVESSNQLLGLVDELRSITGGSA